MAGSSVLFALLILALGGTANAQEKKIHEFVSPMQRVGIQSRIADSAGGDIVPENAYPFVVSVFSRTLPPLPPSEVHFCGGVLVHKRWVLTAGHCIKSVEEPNRIGVFAGQHKLSDGGEVLQVVEIKRHATYVHTPHNTIMWDFALLKLNKDSNKKPVALLDPDDEFRFMVESPGSLFVVGWGQPYYGGPKLTIDLRKAQLTSVSLAECRTKYKHRASLIDETTMLCATKPGGGDACQGDSGGPLIVFHDELNFKPHVVGIVSWGLACGAEEPGVYARLPAVHDWIKGVLNPSN